MTTTIVPADKQNSATYPLFADPWPVTDMKACDFYHAMDIPGVGEVSGQWDLRKGLHDYLGRVDFANKSVIEVGPASGFLTFSMEKLGAQVVGVEPALDTVWDFVPNHTVDHERVFKTFSKHITRLRNGFWYAHRQNQSQAKVHYGNTTQLPADLGTYNIGLFASVLIHCQNPVKLLQAVSQHVSDTLIVTERFFPKLGKLPVCQLIPDAQNNIWDAWWNFTPQFFEQYLPVLGFTQVKTYKHRQLATFDNKKRMKRMFTVVASRK